VSAERPEGYGVPPGVLAIDAIRLLQRAGAETASGHTRDAADGLGQLLEYQLGNVDMSMC